MKSIVQATAAVAISDRIRCAAYIELIRKQQVDQSGKNVFDTYRQWGHN